MITLKEQLKRDKARMIAKKSYRAKNSRVRAKIASYFRPGNKDFGIPFKGADNFSGQWQKFKDRIVSTENGVIELGVFQNNKYTE